VFSLFLFSRRKYGQKKGDITNTTRKHCRLFAFDMLYFRSFILLYFDFFALLCFGFFALLHFYIFVVPPVAIMFIYDLYIIHNYILMIQSHFIKCNNLKNASMKKMKQCERAKMRRDSSCFHILYFEDKEAKIRQIECEYTADFKCRIFALLLSYFRFFSCFENSKKRKHESPPISFPCVFEFWHFEVKKRKYDMA
jgi:hypothetical protein